MSFLSTAIGKGAAIGLAILLLLGIFEVRSCQLAKQHAAQARVDQGQAGAMQNSATDAVAAQGQANANEQASEALTRTNDQEIRHAAGADAQINPAVRDAGLRSLCRRSAYRDSQRCRVFNAPAH
jgi:hypothetical protein